MIQRHDRERQVTLTAKPETGYNTDRVTRAILAELERLDWPEGYGFAAGGEAEARQESFAGLGGAVLVAVFGILAVLVLEFGSFRSMLIVAGVIPLGMVGALAALWVERQHAVVHRDHRHHRVDRHRDQKLDLLVDFTNRLRAEGMALDAAIERGGRGALPAHPAHLVDRDRRAAAAGVAGLGHLFAARDRDHRRAALLDAARAARDAGDVQAAAAGRVRHREPPIS